MAKADLGEKQLCPNCAAKFYDLHKRPAHCPKCNTEFDPGDETVKLKRVKTTRTPTYEAEYEDDEAPRRKPNAEEGEEGEEEVEHAPELDETAEDAAPLTDETEDEEGASPDKIPEGFSEDEADLDADDEAPVDDEDEPILDLDEDEPFDGDDLGEGSPAPGEDDSR